MQTVITVTTIILVVILTEIVEQHLSAADGCLCIGRCLYEQLATDILFSHRLALHELIQFLQIFIRIESQTDTFTTVTTGTTCLLIITLQ